MIILVQLEYIGAEKVPVAPGRRGKSSLTRGNLVKPDKGTGIFLEYLAFLGAFCYTQHIIQV